MDISNIKDKLKEVKIAINKDSSVKKQLQAKVSELNNEINKINVNLLKLEGRIQALVDLTPEGKEREELTDWFNAFNPNGEVVKKTEKADEPKKEEVTPEVVSEPETPKK